MGNSLIIMVVASFVALGAIYGASTQLQLFEAQKGASDSEYTVLARGSALSGLERAKQHLSEDFTPATFTGTLDGVAYDVMVTVDGDVASVVSTGVFEGPIDTVSYDVRAMYKQDPAVPPLPEYLSYGLLVGGNFTLGGTGDVFDIGVTDGSEATTIAKIHTNGNLNVSSGAARAEAFGYYVGSASTRAPSAFTPTYNPDGLPSVESALPVDIPTVDADEIASNFEGTPILVPPSGMLTGLLPGGTREAPLVYHALGNVSLNNVTFSGYAVVVAEGNVNVGSYAGATGSGYDGPQESALAVYTEGRVQLSGNTQLHAQIVTMGGLGYTGTVDIYGSVVTTGSLNLSGTGSIHYVPASAGLSWERDASDDGFRAMSYSEY